MEEEEHWYAFSFNYIDIENNKNISASTCLGFSNKLVNLSRIRKAKDKANISQNAVIISISYLGFMTDTEFRNGE